MWKWNTFVSDPGKCSELSEITRTPEQEEALKATKMFMNTVWSKITLFLSLRDWWKTSKHTDEMTIKDVEEIDTFFQEHPEFEIVYDSEITNQRIILSLKTLWVLKSAIVMRIYWRFLDLFDENPSKYALNGIITSAEIYQETEWISVISKWEINKRKEILLRHQIRWQEDAIWNWIYNNDETVTKKKERLWKLKEELQAINTQT